MWHGYVLIKKKKNHKKKLSNIPQPDIQGTFSKRNFFQKSPQNTTRYFLTITESQDILVLLPVTPPSPSVMCPSGVKGRGSHQRYRVKNKNKEEYVINKINGALNN